MKFCQKQFSKLIYFNMDKLLVLILIGLNFVVTQKAVYNKIVLADPSALCLDGSPGVYYISKGTDPDRILLFFEGGGWCIGNSLATTTQNCYQRSKSDLGSSRSYPENIQFTEGIMSNSIKNQFRNATKIFLKYCDGSAHQGTRLNPLMYKDARLYFRGHNITVAQLQAVQKSQSIFSKVNHIIVSGASAGGLAALIWTNYVRQKAKAQYIYSVPDSGIFLDYPKFNSNISSIREEFINLFKLSNVQISPPVPECVKENQNQPYKCMFAQELYKYVKVPMFFVQSLYDTISIDKILGIQCIKGGSLQNCTEKQRNYIQEYRKNCSRLLFKVAEKQINGFWAPSCAIHMFMADPHFYSEDFRVPMESEYSIDYSLLAWISRQKIQHFHIDDLPWPYNKPCSGLSKNLIQ